MCHVASSSTAIPQMAQAAVTGEQWVLNDGNTQLWNQLV